MGSSAWVLLAKAALCRPPWEQPRQLRCKEWGGPSKARRVATRPSLATLQPLSWKRALLLRWAQGRQTWGTT